MVRAWRRNLGLNLGDGCRWDGDSGTINPKALTCGIGIFFVSMAMAIGAASIIFLRLSLGVIVGRSTRVSGVLYS